MRHETLTHFRSEAPAGRSGEWVVEKFVEPETGQADTRPNGFRSPPGTYTRLRRGHEVFMTDLYPEWWTQRTPIREGLRRGGSVLVTGLGLGLVVEALLADRDGPVADVTVIERSPDVIRLIGPYLSAKFGARVKIVQADAFAWLPPPDARYTVGWHDIWPNPHDRSRWPEMEELERRFAPYCDWQGCWMREHVEAETAPGPPR